jgi:uncharacterized protein (DUF1800 family)
VKLFSISWVIDYTMTLPQAENNWTREEAAHLLNRAGFGGSPAEMAAFHALGRMAAVESLLRTQANTDMAAPSWTAPEQAAEDARERFAMFRDSRQAMKDLSPEEAERKRRMAQQKFQMQERERGTEMQGWWLTRMLSNAAPLHEKMTLFWHDHFATSMQKVKNPVMLFRQNQMFRTYAIGNFKSLTHAVLKDAAMAFYLDLQTSKRGKPNENFAREVMELFTLGQGNYSEEDIRQGARAFTGYEISLMSGSVTHNKRQWDDGEKTFLGQKGNFDGDGIIDVIFEQKQASRYIVTKLWEYFVYEEPSSAALDALAQSFAEQKFELTPLLREIFLSKEFYSEKAMGTQIKCPVVFLVQMLKQLEIPTIPKAYSLYVQSQLGQILFAPPNVAGWDWGKGWVNTNTLLTRYQIAGFITKGGKSDGAQQNMGQVQGFGGGMQRMTAGMWTGPNYDVIVPRASRDNEEALVDALIARLFMRKLSGNVRESFIAYAKDKKGVIFTNQEVAELLHLMMSTPHYQLT